jgi:hypothetical protein
LLLFLASTAIRGITCAGLRHDIFLSLIKAFSRVHGKLCFTMQIAIPARRMQAVAFFKLLTQEPAAISRIALATAG